MSNSKLSKESILPLTCSRAGTCCFGNVVMLNPWELFSLSKEKGITPRAFRDQYCEFGGIKLRFNGIINSKRKQACNLYKDGFGCSVHVGRPLACRLFPLGRQIQNNEVQYIHQGENFPCISECPEVQDLPKLSVGEYLKGQETELFEQAQDAYLEVMQNIADIGFELLLDSGLSASGDKKTIAKWRETGQETPQYLIDKIGKEWLEALIIPEISDYSTDPITFAKRHNEILLLRIQDKVGSPKTLSDLQQGSVLMIRIALFLAQSIGVDKNELIKHWISIAKSHGALE